MTAVKICDVNDAAMLQSPAKPHDGTPLRRRRRSLRPNASKTASVVSHTTMTGCRDATARKPIGMDRDSVASAEILAAMTRQEEASYVCRDYLDLRRLGGRQINGQTPCPQSPCGVSEEVAFNHDRVTSSQEPRGDLGRNQERDDSSSSPDGFTANCRRKMCVWSYHICDHFGLPRDVVAASFKLLDNFLSRVDCDLQVFKLASMTCLHIASKLVTARDYLLPSTLAAVSRGEFQEFHFARMEMVILEAMEWKVNPPTAEAFVDRLALLIPLEDGATREAIRLRARSFAELSVSEYDFVPERASTIALGCVLNALEGLRGALPPRVARAIRRAFLREVELRAGMDYAGQMASCDAVRERLWRTYVEAENRGSEQTCTPSAEGEEGQAIRTVHRKALAHVSPVSVSQDMTFGTSRN